MSGAPSTETLDSEMVEAIAKQLFRAENAPSLLWDAKLFERAGMSTDGFMFVSEDEKAAYRRRAEEVLLKPPG